jgi:UDP-glucose 4-epimerase
VTAHTLLESGAQVTVLDDLRSGSAASVPAAADLVEGDVQDRESVAKVMARGYDAVVHFAASIEAGESMREPERFFDNNTAATLGLLRAVIEAGCDRFLLSSTAAVYGDPEYTPIDEQHPTRPTNAYGESKLLVERALAWLADRGRLHFTALRYFNAAGSGYGLRERHEPETHLIPLALDAAAGTRPALTIFGTDYDTRDGTCVRDYVHVLDLAAAHVRALDRLGGDLPRAINLGSGSGYTVREVIDAVGRATGSQVPCEDGPRRAGDPAVLVASSQLARTALDWEPQLTLDDMVSSARDSRRFD